MSLSSAEVAQLRKIISIAQALLEKSGKPQLKTGKSNRSNGVSGRRSGKELIAFRKALKAERKAGIPVAKIAKRHGVSPSYIYQLG